MQSQLRHFLPLAIAAVFAAAFLATGCAGRARVHYVPYNYFSWNNQEAISYSQWEHDTHREHVDFTLRSNTDMWTYWKSRHGNREDQR